MTNSGLCCGSYKIAKSNNPSRRRCIKGSEYSDTICAAKLDAFEFIQFNHGAAILSQWFSCTHKTIWQEVFTESHEAEGDNPAYRFVTYEKSS